jgi:density-regulated protein DRP1
MHHRLIAYAVKLKITNTSTMTPGSEATDAEAAVLRRIQPVYCGACGMPPEFCEYGPDFETHCLVWLKANHPKLYQDLKLKRGDASADAVAASSDKPERPAEPWTIAQRLAAFYEKYEPEKVDNVPALLEKYAGKEENLFTALTKKYGPEPEDPFYESDEEDDSDDDLREATGDMAISGSKSSKKRRGVGAKKSAKVDTRVVIQKITRNKKKATTVVVGMETIEGMKNLKDASKAFSKRFAGSSSVKDGPKGKEIIIQGDHMDAVAEMVVKEFKVPGHSVYMDIDGEFVPYE